MSQATEERSLARYRGELVVALYTAAIFLSAFLLFSIQPILSKQLLPYLGGSPTVWNTSMMVYQALLLGGYAYAHFIRKHLGRRKHIGLHLTVLAASLLTLPVALVIPPLIAPATEPALWLIVSLLASAGLPFFLLSANAPLLQSWFSRSGHAYADNPYFLYSASNFGSFLALLSYPFLIEPFLGSAGQLALWSWGYGLFAVMVGATGWTLVRRPRETPEPAWEVPETRAAEDAQSRPSVKDKLYWTALAFIPSSLLLGLTQYLTTDIAAFPLLWVIPLAIYLLTFVLAFSHYNDRILKNILLLQLFFLVVALFTLAMSLTGTNIFLAQLVAFAVIAYVCHGQLAASRPHAAHLTEFYLWISFGGVLGGIFNSLLAPQLFTGILEYPLALLLACLLRPRTRAVIGKVSEIKLPGPKDLAWAAGVLLAAAGLVWLGSSKGDVTFRNPALLFLALFALAFLTARNHPLRLAACLAGMLLSAGIIMQREEIVFSERNFFGTTRVTYDAQRNIRSLRHGTTVHGIQSLDPEHQLDPTTYYRPLRQVFAAGGTLLRTAPVALVGLGAGTAVCYGAAGQPFDLYEINPSMVHVASDPDYFSFLSKCPADQDIILGDARLAMNSAPDGRYGLIILDAYSSDSLPVHLATREAMALYLRKLQPGGLLAFHISNRHINMKPVLNAIARDLALELRFAHHNGSSENLTVPSDWIVMARRNEARQSLAGLPPEWIALPETTARAWTDDYSNIVGAMYWSNFFRARSGHR